MARRRCSWYLEGGKVMERIKSPFAKNMFCTLWSWLPQAPIVFPHPTGSLDQTRRPRHQLSCSFCDLPSPHYFPGRSTGPRPWWVSWGRFRGWYCRRCDPSCLTPFYTSDTMYKGSVVERFASVELAEH